MGASSLLPTGLGTVRPPSWPGREVLPFLAVSLPCPTRPAALTGGPEVLPRIAVVAPLAVVLAEDQRVGLLVGGGEPARAQEPRHGRGEHDLAPGGVGLQAESPQQRIGSGLARRSPQRPLERSPPKVLGRKSLDPD